MSEPTSRGFTLLEVLVATLLVAIPVAATQMLMLRSAAVVGDVHSDAHARYAASHFVARVSAFHLGGFWPDSAVSPGQWLRNIDMELSADDLPVSPLGASIAGALPVSGQILSPPIWSACSMFSCWGISVPS